MTEFYFVRHGQTELNLQRAMNGGGVDTALTERGKEEAIKLGIVLCHQNFDFAVSSQLQRAKRTMELILASNDYKAITPTSTRAGFGEMRLGDFDGQLVSAIKKSWDYQQYRYHPVVFDAEVARRIHAETYKEVITRACETISDLYKEMPHQRILVVSHGLLLMTLINSLLGDALETLHDVPMMANASLTRIDTQNGIDFKLCYYSLLPDAVEEILKTHKTS